MNEATPYYVKTSAVTIRESITRGIRIVSLPARILLVATIALCILLLNLFFSWWDLLLLPAGLLFYIIYSFRAASKWQIWAYEHTEDIHQLQRSAELAGLLMKGSHERAGFFTGERQGEKLKTLQKRFLEESAFADDPSIPSQTQVYAKSFLMASKSPTLILDDNGIQVDAEAFFEWDQINNERIAQVSYRQAMPHSRIRASGGTKYCFRFECQGQRIDLPVSTLRISGWELDLLLYIYRGRSQQRKTGRIFILP